MRALLDPAIAHRAAQRIWAEGRVNPIDLAVQTRLGPFITTDRCTWRTPDLAWTAELRRSKNGHHLYLVLFHEGTYVGRYDVSGWHAASTRSRVRHLRSPQLALRLVA
jgi:hypothetical protein